MDKMSLYYHSPILLQNLLTTAEGWRLRRMRYGDDYRSYRDELAQRDYSSRASLLENQDRQFSEFVRFAARNSPFYRKFYGHVDLDSVRGVSDAHLLPILEKETLRRNIGEVYTINPSEGSLSSTSGTSGKSLTVRFTSRDSQRRMAYLDHFKAQHGFENIAMRRASFASPKIIPPKQKRAIFWRDNHAMKQRLYSGYHCHGDNLRHYVDNLIQYAPESIDGYPSAIHQMAAYILSRRVRLRKPPVAIFPTAEMLYPDHKNIIEEAFQCPVLDQYASSEGAPFVTMCERGRRHYCLDTGVIEADSTGDILITGFETHGTPLIRYRVGDKMDLAPASDCCECGNALPLVREIKGRTHDFLYATDGHKVPAIYLSLVSGEFQNSVRSMQFVQHRIGEVKVVLTVDHGADLATLGRLVREKLLYSFGSETSIEVLFADHIEREASGKHRLIVNEVRDPSAGTYTESRMGEPW